MSNSFYNHGGAPTPDSPGASQAIRTELANVAIGFDKLPTLSGNGLKIVRVNSGGTALEATGSLSGLTGIDGTPIGATTPSTVNATTVNATVGLTGSLTGNVTGNVVGNVTSSGTSTFQNVTINGTLDMNAGSGNTITGLSTPSAASDAATKSYVDTSISNLVASAPGTLDTLNELATALGNDPSFATTMTNSLATKLPLAGGTMSGAIAMGSNKITGLGTPTAGNDAVNKTYIDTLYGSTVAAAASASAAATSETNAATSASTAATQAGNAATSASNAAASYDAFDDRYLGNKASNPTLDNDGNALLTGALYFNTSVNEMRVYNGSSWVATYIPAASYVTLTGAQTVEDKTLKTIKTATFDGQYTNATTTGAVTIDWTAGQNQKQAEPTGTITYTFTAPLGPCHLQLLIDSDGTSTAQTITWPGSVVWLGQTWAGAANKKAVINFWYDGTSYYAMGANQV